MQEANQAPKRRVFCGIALICGAPAANPLSGSDPKWGEYRKWCRHMHRYGALAWLVAERKKTENTPTVEWAATVGAERLAAVEVERVGHGNAEHVEGLVGRLLDGAPEGVDDFHCDLVGAAIDVVQREDRAAARVADRLAVQQQAVAVAGQQGWVAGGGNDQGPVIGAYGGIGLRHDDAQQLVGRRAGRQRGSGRCVERRRHLHAVGRAGLGVGRRQLQLLRVAARRLVGEDAVALLVDVGVDLGAGREAEQYREQENHQMTHRQLALRAGLLVLMRCRVKLTGLLAWITRLPCSTWTARV